MDVLAASLADFVYEHRDSNTGFSWDGPNALPTGYCHIGVFDVLESEGGGEWRYFRGFSTGPASRELLEERINDKNKRVADYRRAASEVWLLMVNDLFLGPGEVHARHHDLAEWAFDFDFDKVLVFSRQPGGSGNVIELRRRS